ncbi:MAG: DUF1015 family protein [Planctomycetota bacterium]|nr:DUF1015 family protein [Planctomycetota bacterium]
MVRVRPFAALRPVRELADKIASPPYDVLKSDEARAIISKNEYSFLKVIKPEATLSPDTDQYDQKVYQRGKENLDAFRKAGWLRQDDKPHLYAYRQVMGNHSQLGLVACASTLDYEADRIKKHELTREAKEKDRMTHIETLNAQAGPVFLTYKADREVDTLMEQATKGVPEYDFTDELNVRHTFWVIEDEAIQNGIIGRFAQMDRMYVADGHHRSASATAIMKKRRKDAGDAFTGNEEYERFLSVIFPHDQMHIMPYNRVVKEVPEGKPDDLLKKLEKTFNVVRVETGESTGVHDMRIFTEGSWFKLTLSKARSTPSDPVASLDCAILQQNILEPFLGIANPRTSDNIDFVGGIKGVTELEGLVTSGEYQVAFSLYHVTIDQLMAIADAGKIMPPKSTWFEPKLRSGVAVHLLD